MSILSFENRSTLQIAFMHGVKPLARVAGGRKVPRLLSLLSQRGAFRVIALINVRIHGYARR